MQDFELITTEDRARLGKLHFKGGLTVPTPVFMPVGTRATVKALHTQEIQELGYDLILGNTYHLHLRPGEDVINSFGGLAKFMSYPGAILTDSGGFQVFSLSKLVKFFDEGVEFRSHLDGAKVMFTPRKVIDIQLKFDSDIIMILDDCPPYPADPKRLEDSLVRTLNWAKEAALYRHELRDAGRTNSIFAIVQGGLDKDARRRSISEICELDFDSYAIGGLSVGEPRDLFYEILEYSVPLLPNNKPRYLMGVGTIPDILEGVKQGVDMFDCVLPTRNSRRGQVFTFQGKKNLRNLKYQTDSGPIDAECSCNVCQNYSIGYIRHLFHVQEITAMRLATYHNLAFMKQFMSLLRESIANGTFSTFYSHWKNLYA